MTQWTSLGLALPARRDVDPAENREALVAGLEYATAYGFPSDWINVQDAFNNKLTEVLESGGTGRGSGRGGRRPVNGNCDRGSTGLTGARFTHNPYRERPMTAETATTPQARTSMREAHRREARVGFAFIAVPMALS